EGEARRCPLRPCRRSLPVRQRVVGRVDLDQGELPRVVTQPLLRRAGFWRIPAAYAPGTPCGIGAHPPARLGRTRPRGWGPTPARGSAAHPPPAEPLV